MKEIEINYRGKTISFLVSNCDYEWVRQWKWCYNGRGYVRRGGKQINGKREKSCLLHREIFKRMAGNEIPAGYIVDHIDRNKLNNQRNNLRLVTYQQNSQNHSKLKTNTSGYIGVYKYYQTYKDKIYYNWKAYIRNPQTHKQIQKWFPYTDEGKIAAAKWYDMKAKEYFGEYCGELNFE